ncbi:MAG: GGDEF domain-containing protein [Aliidongia sp.]
MAKGSGALVYLDINNLKAQNDVGGHLSGDRAILTCAEILRNCTRPTDLIARIGGDEFLLWLDGVTQEGAAGRAEALPRPCRPADRAVRRAGKAARRLTRHRRV